MKAIVIGAGIGGMSAALALEKAGFSTAVYEAVKRDETGRRGHLYLA
jgi:FAD binding domain.